MQGWIAVGFDPSYGMKDADFIMAFIDDDKLIVRDEYGDGAFGHRLDTDAGGSRDVTALKYERSEKGLMV